MRGFSVLAMISEEQYEAEKRKREADVDYHFKATCRSTAKLFAS